MYLLSKSIYIRSYNKYIWARLLQSRRIQKVGVSTLAVSLPKEWVRSVGLKKGDIIFLEQDRDGSLKIMTIKQIKEKSSGTILINADICKDHKMLMRVLKGIYSLGHDRILITSSERLRKEQMDSIRSVTRELVGPGILEETPSQVTVQCSIDITKFDLETVLRRLYLIASTMHRDLIDAISELNVKIAEESINRSVEAETIYWLASRLLNSCQRDSILARKMKIENPMQILWWRFAAHYLRLIADCAKKMAQKIIALSKNFDRIGELLKNDMIKINEDSYAVCHKAINSFFSNNAELANEAIEDYLKVQKAEEKIQERICTHAYLHSKSFSVSKYFKGKKPIEPCMIAQISFIVWAARRIAELGSEIAETAIHKTLCKYTNLCKPILEEK